MAENMNSEVSQEELDALLGGQQQIEPMQPIETAKPVKDLSGEEKRYYQMYLLRLCRLQLHPFLLS